MDSVTNGNPSNDENFRDAKDEVVTEEQLQIISEKILNKECKRLARKLGLDEGEIDAIDNDYKDDTKEKHFQMLLKWRRKFGDEATTKKLEEAFGILPKVNKKQLPAVKQNSIVEHFTVIRDYLMGRYKYVQLPIGLIFGNKLLFLSEHFVDLTLKLQDMLGEEEGESTPSNIHRIFKRINGKIPKVILIESDPGYGKTTLGLKLVSDWSNGRRYMTGKFDLVFYLSFTHFTGNLNKMLLKEIKEIDWISEEDKLEVIQWKKENVLLILDDFDQVPDPLKLKLIQMLKWKQPFCEMVIIVTSRTEGMECKANDEDSDHLSEIGAKSIEYEILSLWDKRIQIKGISQENKDQFIMKYFPNDLTNFLFPEKYFNLITNSSRDFYYSPMYLLFSVILLKDKEVEKIKSRTDFFIKIFNSLTKRSLIRNKTINLEEEVDLFNHDEAQESEYRSLLLQFGKLALEKLNRYENSFTREEILSNCNGDERIFDLGFLTKVTEYETHRLVEKYETWHEKVLDFLAAFFVSDTLLFSSTNITKTNPVVDSLKKNQRVYIEDSLLGPFIIGLMKSQAYKVRRYVHWRFFRNNLVGIHLEIEYSYKNIISIWQNPFTYLIFLTLLLFYTYRLIEDYPVIKEVYYFVLVILAVLCIVIFFSLVMYDIKCLLYKGYCRLRQLVSMKS